MPDAAAVVAVFGGRPNGSVNSLPRRMELVVPRDLLRELAVFLLEHDEVPEQVQEARLLEDAANKHLELVGGRRG